MQEFIVFLKLNEGDQRPAAEKSEIVGRHFSYLMKLQEEGKVLLAGRTQVQDPIGLVMLLVEDLKAANALVLNDPAVSEKVMNFEIFPYQIALGREKLIN